ncbi:MAG TPA: polymer-forming cytoskeletal protein, partial [Gammaproteobacteria bacterium]|nr:polymer-forming cytoskeletal protein [Gammaproteobacteria bacterium]
GIVKGNIYAQSGSKAVVRISEKGRVQGEIRVPRIIVNGEVLGDIWSDKHIELAAKAEVKGNVYYHLIEMVQGSRIDGQLVHLQDGKQEVAESKPAKAAEKADEDAAALVTAVKNQTA